MSIAMRQLFHFASDTCVGSRTVTTSGTVDNNTVGYYTLTYSANDGSGNTGTATRLVSVQALQPPNLSITRNGTHVILSWSGIYTLQAATDVPMIFSDIFTGAGPYTAGATNDQTYYKLKN